MTTDEIQRLRELRIINSKRTLEPDEQDELDVLETEEDLENN